MDGFLPNLTYTIDIILENSKFGVLTPEERQEIRDYLLKNYYERTIQTIIYKLPEDKVLEFKELAKEGKDIMSFLMVNVPNFNGVFEQATALFINELISVCILEEEYTYGSLG